MNCKHCGCVLPDRAFYCPQCGKPEHNEPQFNSTPYYSIETTECSLSEDCLKLSKRIFTNGILALSFACSFWLSFLGIVFGIKTLVATRKFINSGGVLTGKTRSGSIFGKVGMILGIVLYCVLVFLLFFAILEVVLQKLFYIP